MIAEHSQRRAVGRHGAVGEVSSYNLREPSPDFRNWHVLS
jgi:hypothetical protein